MVSVLALRGLQWKQTVNQRRKGGKMKILLMTVSAGQGHTAAATALEARLRQLGAAAHTIDVYQYINSFIAETLDKSTALYTKVAPDIYRMVYDYLEGGVEADQTNVFQLINKLCAYKMSRLTEEYDPDVILCTHVFAAQLADELKRRGKTRAYLAGVVTDYTIHPYWETLPRLDWLIVAAEPLIYRAVKRGIPARRIKALGIPIHPKFREKLEKKEARRLLGLNPEGPAALMMGGGLGYGLSLEDADRLLDLRPDFQLMAVCGRNQKQLRRFEQYQRETGRKNLRVYGFVENVQQMMDAADLLISKPGGLTVTEALAKELPMAIVSPIAGHEERNLEFLLNCGMAVSASKTFPLDEAVHLLLSSPGRLEQMRQAVRAQARPRALEDICQFLLSLPLRQAPAL